MSEVDIEKAQRESTRWRILCVLQAGRPLPVSEDIVQRALEDASMRITPSLLRRELDYLSDRKLVTLHGLDGPVWSAQLTHYGVDVVEYTVDCFPGIARPRKWY